MTFRSNKINILQADRLIDKNDLLQNRFDVLFRTEDNLYFQTEVWNFVYAVIYAICMHILTRFLFYHPRGYDEKVLSFRKTSD